MKLTMHRVLPVLCISTLLLFQGPRNVAGWDQETAPAPILSATVGLDGSSRVGEWTPINIRVEGAIEDGATVEAVTSDPQGYPVTVSAVASKSVSLFVQFGRLETSLLVRLVNRKGAVLASRRLSTKSAAGNDESDFTVQRHAVPRWIVAGKLPATEAVSRIENSDNPLTDVHITPLVAAEIATNPLKLASYDTIFLSGEFTLSPEQARALDHWVKRGGQLVCFVGDRDRIESFQASPLHDWFPGIEIQSKRVSDLSGVEAFVQSGLDDGESEPLFIGARRVAVAAISLPESIALDQGGLSGSVLTETARGFGRVTFAGFDMDRRPLSLWGEKGSGQFLRKLTGTEVATENTNRRSSRVSRSGVTDLATQFRESSEHLPGQAERSTLAVLGLVLLYLLLIGPADYLLVHRVLKKPHLTWVTFPTIVVMGALLARTAAQTANGTDLRVTQVDVVDIDMTSGFVRELAWCSIFSPENARYRVALRSTGNLMKQDGRAEPVTGEFKLGWFGMPEENYGGMYRAAGLELGHPGYRFSGRGNGIDNLPIPIWSNRSLHAENLRWTTQELVVSNLKRSGTGGQFSSDSQFTHHLPVPIEDWLIVYESRAYYSADRGSEHASIRPGELWTPLNSSGTSQDLASFLNGTSYRQVEVTGTPITATKGTTTITDYDPQDRNLAGVMTMITFHERSGGSGYTGLKNAALQHLELSRHISLNRAVLLGRVSLPGSTLEVDGQSVEAERHESFVRILLPVQPTEHSSILPEIKE